MMFSFRKSLVFIRHAVTTPNTRTYLGRCSLSWQNVVDLRDSLYLCVVGRNILSYHNQKDTNKMVDPKRVLSYEDMLKVIDAPKKVIIDVRNPDEVASTGKIPSSINIPLSNVDNTLARMSNEDFRRQFQREKPSSNDELIFYCRSGRRSSEALDKALKLGYTNSKTYLGSWDEWSRRNNK